MVPDRNVRRDVRVAEHPGREDREELRQRPRRTPAGTLRQLPRTGPERSNGRGRWPRHGLRTIPSRALERCRRPSNPRCMGMARPPHGLRRRGAVSRRSHARQVLHRYLPGNLGPGSRAPGREAKADGIRCQAIPVAGATRRRAHVHTGRTARVECRILCFSSPPIPTGQPRRKCRHAKRGVPIVASRQVHTRAVDRSLDQPNTIGLRYGLSPSGVRVARRRCSGHCVRATTTTRQGREGSGAGARWTVPGDSRGFRFCGASSSRPAQLVRKPHREGARRGNSRLHQGKKMTPIVVSRAQVFSRRPNSRSPGRTPHDPQATDQSRSRINS